MRTGAAKKGTIPTFRSDREERECWAHHSVEKFTRDLEDLDVEVRPPRTEQIALRLDKEDLHVLRSLAATRGVETARRRLVTDDRGHACGKVGIEQGLHVAAAPRNQYD